MSNRFGMHGYYYPSELSAPTAESLGMLQWWNHLAADLPVRLLGGHEHGLFIASSCGYKRCLRSLEQSGESVRGVTATFPHGTREGEPITLVQ